MGVVGPAFAKFALAGGALMFRADVNMHPAEVVLDPAVAITAVSEDYARRLHLHHGEHRRVRGAGGTVEGDEAGPIDIKLGHSWFRVPRVIITALPGISDGAGKADIVVGADALATTHLAIDFDKGELQAISDSDFAHAVKRYDPVQLAKAPTGDPLIDVRIGDEPATKAKLDFANTIPLLMSERFRSDRRLNQSGPRSTGLAATPAGIRPSVTFSVPAITIDGAVLKDVPAAAVEGPASELTLGLPIFEQYQVILDLGHDRLWLHPGKGKPFDRDLIGVTVTRHEGGLSIAHVAAHSPAEAAGMRSGSRITAIDGKPIDDSYYSSGLWRWQFGSSKSKVAVTVDGHDIDLTYRRFD